MNQLGQYKILRKLGAGAMGEVYLAEHQLLKAKRALKVLPSELSASQSFRERFMAEGQVLARLRHPHIVQVHDMGVEDNVHYIAMEFVSPDGRQVWPLDRLLAKSGGRMQPGAAARVLLQVCEAIAYAHEQGVIHCDIKPSNILVVRNNEVCVSDFGLSKVLGKSYLNKSIQASLSGSVGMDQTRVLNTPHDGTDESLGAEATLNGKSSSRAKSLVGTFHYMPPEVQKGQEWTEQGDIYSIGVLAYLLLTGDLPIGRWKLPREIIPNMEPFWDRLVEQALQTDPSRRFPSAKAILEVIRKQGHTATTTVTSRSFEKSDDMPLLVRQKIRDFVEAHQGRWTETQFLEFQVQLYQNPKYAGVPRKAIIKAVETETNQWLEKDTREKEEEARLAEERRKATEEAEHRFRDAREAKKRIESATYPVYGQRPGQVQAFAGIDFCWIPPGNFMMGQPGEQHPVTITRGFWLGKYPVMQAQWEAVMVNNPSHFKGDGRLPVECVSWDDCQAFCLKMNQQGKGQFRLPTEAEWEYACRASTLTAYYFGDKESQLGKYAWYDENSGLMTHIVGGKKPNGWGLYDMHGNVWEWCQDWYAEYLPGAVQDPTGPSSGQYRILRGGSWDLFWGKYCRSDYRRTYPPDARFADFGFRVARIP